MIKDHERFNNISSGIQNLVLAVAIVIGGLWTAFTFSTLSTKYRSQAEITELDLRNARTRDEIAQNGAVIDIKLEAKQETFSDDKKYCISVLTKITNTGVRNTLVDLSKGSPLTAYLVYFNDDGTSNRRAVVSQEDYTSSSTTLRSGNTIELPLFVKVESKGLYILEFRIPLDQNARLIDSTMRGTKFEHLHWIGSTYVEVK